MSYLVKILKIIWIIVLILLSFDIITRFFEIKFSLPLFNNLITFINTPFSSFGLTLEGRINVSSIVALVIYSLFGFIILEILRVLFPYEKRVVEEVETPDDIEE